jgi:hypothetical protein
MGKKQNDVRYRKDGDNFIINHEGFEFTNKAGYYDIYCIKNTVSGKVYIGKTKQIYGENKPCAQGYLGRFKYHINKFKGFIKNREKPSCRALYSAMEKYGPDKFTVSCLCVCKNSVVDNMEKYFIQQYKSISPGGYNLTLGGEGGFGRIFSEATKEKLRDVNLTQTSDYYEENFTNKHHTDPRLFRKCTKEIYLKIIPFKKILQGHEMVDKIKEEYGVILTRDDISKFWQGEYTNRLPKDITDLQEYKKMLTIKGKRTCNKVKKSPKFLTTVSEVNKEKRRNFTEEQLYSIMKDKLLPVSATNCGKKYISHKTAECIPRNSVEKIWKGTILPLKPVDDEYRKLLDYDRKDNK